MELSQQVCNLQQAKRLKELGVKQESLFRWVSGRMEYGYEGEWNIVDTEEDNYFLFDHVIGKELNADDFQVDAGYISGEMSDKEYDAWEKRKKKKEKACLSKVCSAFTVAELGVMLPEFVYSKLNSGGGEKWCCLMIEGHVRGVKEKDLYDEYADTEAEARAAMLIHLLENKILTAEVK